MALFGMTAKQWRDNNTDKKGNIRDDATLNQLLAVELSYLTEDEQYELHAVMDWSMSNRTLIRI